MELANLVHPQDLVIDRDSSKITVALYDCDGNYLWSFDSSWSDDQIKEVVRFANHAFRKGYETGKHMELHRVQTALGIPALIRSMATATDDRKAS